VRYYLGLIGVVLLAGASWLFLRRFALVINGVVTAGRVESFEARNADESTAYHPVVVFKDREHRVHRFTSVAGGSSPSPPVGTTVPVRYLRSNPNSAVISSFLHMWAAPVALAVLGTCSMVAFWQW
jgi:hypothetical protein